MKEKQVLQVEIPGMNMRGFASGALNPWLISAKGVCQAGGVGEKRRKENRGHRDANDHAPANVPEIKNGGVNWQAAGIEQSVPSVIQPKSEGNRAKGQDEGFLG